MAHLIFNDYLEKNEDYCAVSSEENSYATEHIYQNENTFDSKRFN